MMKAINSKFLIFYFKWFWIINAVIASLFALTSLFLSQSNMIVLAYCIFMGFLYICAKINFELRRPQAGIGFTLLVICVFRLVIPPAIRNNIGAFAHTNPQNLQNFYELVTSNNTILVFAILGVIAAFFLVWDHKIAIDRSHVINA